jgi:hypothetical protein
LLLLLPQAASATVQASGTASKDNLRWIRMHCSLCLVE